MLLLSQFRTINRIFEEEYHNLSLWYCVGFISGIVTYFTLDSEPSGLLISSIMFFFIVLLIVLRRNIFLRFLLSLIISFFIGVLISKYRTYSNNLSEGNFRPNRLLGECIISPVEGIVKSIKPTNHGSQIILQQVTIYKLKQQLPKVRITMPVQYANNIDLNHTVKLVAKLCKPQNSLLPGGYDFSFYAYFSHLKATGYALAPPIIIADNKSLTNSFIYKIRKNIYTRLIQVLGAINGNFVAAILLGETKALNQGIMQAMRQGGISHILCVSGLHLSLVATILFIAIRFLLNCSNYLAYNYNIKVMAAICSLIGSYCYLELTGMQIAATRAFIMTAIFMYAIMKERSIHPLRSLATAAFIILSVNPEVIFHPSFQLSFIAVLSLTSGYEFYLRNQWILGESKGIFSQVKFYYLSNIYSSLLAGVVTAPVVINQFYTFPTYSILLNLIAVPIMSFFLMPLALTALLLMLLGIDWYCLQLMGFFINLIIKSVKFTSLLPSPIWYFGYISKISLIVFLFGFFWICLWQTKWRFLGVIIILISFLLMLISPLPNFIVDIREYTIGLKNINSQLEIYIYSTDLKKRHTKQNYLPYFKSNTPEQITNFKYLYWARWFGQKEAPISYQTSPIFISNQNILLSDDFAASRDGAQPIDNRRALTNDARKFISEEYKLIINSDRPNNKCENADIYINHLNSHNRLLTKCQGNKLTLSTLELQKTGVIMIFCNPTECKITTNNNRFNKRSVEDKF